MGFVNVEVGISSPIEPEHEERVELVVDTGAVLGVIQRELLEGLGIRPIDWHDFREFGGLISRETGTVLMR